jgi:transposase
MTPKEHLTQFLLFPELEFEGHYTPRRGWMYFTARSKQNHQACGRCATISTAIYDHRTVKLKDAPVRDHRIKLIIHKRRFFCKPCKKPFTELLPSVFKGCRITERLKRHILYLCKNFTNLHAVGKSVGVSSSTVFRSFYQYLSVEKGRHLNYALPKKIGMDEHGFRQVHYGNFRQGQLYCTVLTDFKNHRLYRMFQTKSPRILFEQMKNLEGRDNVEDVVIDFSEGYRSLSKALFPKARITVDKFHALNLLTPAINRRRKFLSGDRRKNPIGHLILKNPAHLGYFKRSLIDRWLSPHEELKTIYTFRNRIFALYNCRGKFRASQALANILEDLQTTLIPELKALKKTLTRWQNEILNYFETGLTNAMTEGFNNKAKLVKRMAYGYKNFENYELRVLSACFF